MLYPLSYGDMGNVRLLKFFTIFLHEAEGDSFVGRFEPPVIIILGPTCVCVCELLFQEGKYIGQMLAIDLAGSLKSDRGDGGNDLPGERSPWPSPELGSVVAEELNSIIPHATLAELWRCVRTVDRHPEHDASHSDDHAHDDADQGAVDELTH